MDFLVGFFGTFNRTQWWMAQILILPIGMVLFLVSLLFFTVSYVLGFTAMFAVLIFLLMIQFASTAKRFRDRGKSPLWTLICLVPIGALWIVVECGFFPSKHRAGKTFNTTYDGPISEMGNSATNELPQTQTSRFGSHNMVEDNSPKPLFGV